MTFRTGLCAAIILFVVAVGLAGAQTEPYRGPIDEPRAPMGDPRLEPADPRLPPGDPRDPPYQAQPPQAPTFQRREAPQQPPPPFTLSPDQQRQLDWVLDQWEKTSRDVKKFECQVVRFEYDPVFGDQGDAGQPTYRDNGRIWYAAPDKGRFEVYGERAEKWICDGKAIYQYDFKKKEVVQYDLPPELQGKAISQGPLPFLFGSTAADLRNRYWIRLTPPPEGVKDQIWLQSLPKFQADRANFKQAEMILTSRDIRPIALMTVLPNNGRVSYRFVDPKVNPQGSLFDPLGVFNKDAFAPSVPSGWKKVIEPTAPRDTQASPARAVPVRRDENGVLQPLPLSQRPPEGRYR